MSAEISCGRSTLRRCGNKGIRRKGIGQIFGWSRFTAKQRDAAVPIASAVVVARCLVDTRQIDRVSIVTPALSGQVENVLADNFSDACVDADVIQPLIVVGAAGARAESKVAAGKAAVTG